MLNSLRMRLNGLMQNKERAMAQVNQFKNMHEQAIGVVNMLNGREAELRESIENFEKLEKAGIPIPVLNTPNNPETPNMPNNPEKPEESEQGGSDNQEVTENE